MTLCRRVILILQFNDGVLFRTKRFQPDYRYTQSFSWSGDADEIVFLDITRKPNKASRAKFLSLLEKYGRGGVSIPVVAGGHVRSWQMARENLNCGADAVVVGYGGRNCYEEIAGQAGCQALVAGIDHEKLDVRIEQNTIRAGIPVEEACAEAQRLGAGEILLTSIERDGSLGGFDLSNLRRVRSAVKTPLIVAGGCGSWSHIREAFEAGADGAATSNIFHLNETAMRSCKQWLKTNYDGPIREAA